MTITAEVAEAIAELSAYDEEEAAALRRVLAVLDLDENAETSQTESTSLT